MPDSEFENLRDAHNKNVDFIAFSGGGAKGAIYSGVVETLHKKDVLRSVKAVAGSSAGAITAALVATGITTEEFTRISSTTNLKGLLGKGFLINKDGKPLYELLQRTIVQNVSNFISSIDVENLCASRIAQITSDKEEFYAREQLLLQKQHSITLRVAKLLESQASHILDDTLKIEEIEELKQLKAEESDIVEDIEMMRHQNREANNNINKLQQILLNDSEDFKDLKRRCLAGGKIYFKDISLLRTIDPEKFKDLVVTAVRKDTAELTIFSPHNTPDIEVALACRASASIPLVFEPVEIEIEENGKKIKKQFVDGGYRDNVPTKYFEDITNNPQKKGRTIALAFGSNKEGDELHTAMFSSKEKITSYSKLAEFLVDILYKTAAKIGGLFKYTKSEEMNRQEHRANALNIATLNTGKVGTLSFDKAQAEATTLHIKGKIQTERYLANAELVEKQDQTLNLREFLLNVVESTGNDRKRSWVSLAKDPRDDGKASALLAYCEEKIWQGKDNSDVLEQFIALASVNRKTGRASNETHTIEHLISALNDKRTPPDVVNEFGKLLEKESGQKFVKSDFDKIIQRQMSIAPNNKGVIR